MKINIVPILSLIYCLQVGFSTFCGCFFFFVIINYISLMFNFKTLIGKLVFVNFNIIESYM